MEIHASQSCFFHLDRTLARPHKIYCSTTPLKTCHIWILGNFAKHCAWFGKSDSAPLSVRLCLGNTMETSDWQCYVRCMEYFSLSICDILQKQNIKLYIWTVVFHIWCATQTIGNSGKFIAANAVCNVWCNGCGTPCNCLFIVTAFYNHKRNRLCCGFSLAGQAAPHVLMTTGLTSSL